MNPEQLQSMELTCFSLFAMTMRGNPSSMCTKMDAMRKLAEVLRIDPKMGFNILQKLRYNADLEQMAQQSEVFDQMHVPDQPVDLFDGLLQTDFKYQPDVSGVKVKQDYQIPEKNWEGLDFNLFEDILLNKDNQMTKFAKFYNQRSQNKHIAKSLYNLQKMLLVTADQGLRRYARRFQLHLNVDPGQRQLIKQIMLGDESSSSSEEESD